MDVETLRQQSYNAALLSVTEVHRDLRIFRVVPDEGLPSFEPGQYISLGLGNWEPRVEGTDEEIIDDVHRQRLASRAYSISCSILDNEGHVRRVQEFPYLEFYVSLVRHGERRPPALTPRLFRLRAGDRLFVGRHASGHYTLTPVRPHHDVFFLATGTGEAPHNAMIAELLSAGHAGRIVSAVCVRYRKDAAYRAVHEQLVRRYDNYRYLVVTTREPENIDPGRPDYVGKQYLQDLTANGELERQAGVPLDPARAHVFLCGSPAMIGIPAKRHEEASPGESVGMVALLAERGFSADTPAVPGNVHFERYW